MKKSNTRIHYRKKKLDANTMLDLYKAMLYPRMVEQKMLKLLRQGKVSKWFCGIGQESIGVGVTKALRPDEYIFSMHRHLGVFTTRGVPLQRLIAQWQGKASGFTKGRDRSFHFGSQEHHIVGMISHLGPQLALAAGVALANKLEENPSATVVFTGDGGTSEGDFHEALNVAAVWQLPVIFIIENNGYALSTPVKEQYLCQHLADKGAGYGIRSFVLDGNNVLDVYRFMRKWAQKIRKNPEPILLECKTFRMHGHEEASGTKYVPKTLLEYWATKDPVDNYARFLEYEGILSPSEKEAIIHNYKDQINQETAEAFAEDDIQSTVERELEDVYYPVQFPEELIPDTEREIRFIDAISEGLDQAMQEHSNLILMGQDIAEYGGVFKVTQGFLEKYGKQRVRNTPLCESAIVGMALGLTFKGHRAMMEMQFADFVTCGFNQIVNNLAKIHYRWGHAANVVIRMPTGAGVGAGPFHSQSNETWFTHIPGLKVVYPSTPQDAKGLLLSSFYDPNPVLYFEHKYLYRTLAGKVSEEPYIIPIGKANLVHEGSEISVITYGLGVHWALEVTQEMDLDADILDLRTLLPLDFEAIEITVKKTGKVLILHEDTLTGGIGGEISAYISEHLFSHLDAPIFRCASLDTPVPFAKPLENEFLAITRLRDKLTQLLDY